MAFSVLVGLWQTHQLQLHISKTTALCTHSRRVHTKMSVWCINSNELFNLNKCLLMYLFRPSQNGMFPFVFWRGVLISFPLECEESSPTSRVHKCGPFFLDAFLPIYSSHRSHKKSSLKSWIPALQQTWFEAMKLQKESQDCLLNGFNEGRKMESNQAL